VSEEKQRTIQQNKALHKYNTNLSEALNDAGLDMKKVLKPHVDIPWTPEAIKEHIVKPVTKAMFNKDSTADLTTIEMQKVYEVVNRHISEKFGVSVDWPSRS
jgi:hypothetical protein